MTAVTKYENADLPTDVNLDLDDARTPSAVLGVFRSLGFDPSDDEADGIRSLTVVEDKNTLVKVPFMAIRWRFNEGDMGRFVSVECMDERGNLFVINDGSTGILAQFEELTEHRAKNGHKAPQAGRMVRGGLRRSDYQVENPGKPGEMMSATTYYVQF